MSVRVKKEGKESESMRQRQRQEQKGQPGPAAIYRSGERHTITKRGRRQDTREAQRTGMVQVTPGAQRKNGARSWSRQEKTKISHPREKRVRARRALLPETGSVRSAEEKHASARGAHRNTGRRQTVTGTRSKGNRSRRKENSPAGGRERQQSTQGSKPTA